MSETVGHPRFPPRRGAVRARSWWARAWLRSVEESAYGEAELRGARARARAGAVGGILVGPGSVIAAVDDGEETWSVEITVPRLPAEDLPLLVELIGAQTGRVAALLAGDLPLELIEECEEAGIELLPGSGELDPSCGCAAWMPPCVHALAVMYQLAWLFDKDPFVLLSVRGVGRDALLAQVHERAAGSAGPESIEVDLEVALEAMRTAADLLDQAEAEDVDGRPHRDRPSTSDATY